MRGRFCILQYALFTYPSRYIDYYIVIWYNIADSMGEGITVGRKAKPKVELTEETIRKLPAAAVIEKHRNLRVLLKRG